MTAVSTYLEKRAFFGRAAAAPSMAQRFAQAVGGIGNAAVGGAASLARGIGSAANPRAIGGLAGEAAAIAGVAGLGAAATQVYYGATKRRDFNAMLKHDPSLREHRDKDPQRFNQYYSSLRGLNPEFAADPVVASHFMRNMSDQPEAAGQVLVQSLRDAPRRDPLVRMPGVSSLGESDFKRMQHGLNERKFTFDQSTSSRYDTFRRTQHGLNERKFVFDQSTSGRDYKWKQRESAAKAQHDAAALALQGRGADLNDRKFQDEAAKRKFDMALSADEDARKGSAEGRARDQYLLKQEMEWEAQAQAAGMPPNTPHPFRPHHPLQYP